jgi:hypothetical protein
LPKQLGEYVVKRALKDHPRCGAFPPLERFKASFQERRREAVEFTQCPRKSPGKVT